GPNGLGTIVQRLRLDPRSVTPPEVRWLQGVAGNHAVGQLAAAYRSSRPPAAPRVQRQVVLEQMHGGEAAVTSLELLNKLDGVALFTGVEYALPLIQQHGYTFFEDMHHEAPGVFVSEARVRYVTDQFISGKITSQVLAVASDQVSLQSKSVDDQRKFEWACENLTAQMLMAPLTWENFSLLMLLHQKLGVTPNFVLLAFVRI